MESLDIRGATLPLTYDDSAHIYRYGGVVIPSVTQCISALYAGAFEKIPQAILERKTEIGKAVHLATQYHDEGCLDRESLDETVRGYVDAYIKFLSENDCQWTGVEQRVFHPVHKYAGTLDRKGYVNGEFTYLDLKCVAVVNKATGCQLAGYVAADEHTLPFAEKMLKPKRVALQLKPNGTYERYEFSSPNDFPVFISCLTVRRFTCE